MLRSRSRFEEPAGLLVGPLQAPVRSGRRRFAEPVELRVAGLLREPVARSGLLAPVSRLDEPVLQIWFPASRGSSRRVRNMALGPCRRSGRQAVHHYLGAYWEGFHESGAGCTARASSCRGRSRSRCRSRSSPGRTAGAGCPGRAAFAGVALAACSGAVRLSWIALTHIWRCSVTGCRGLRVVPVRTAPGRAAGWLSRWPCGLTWSAQPMLADPVSQRAAPQHFHRAVQAYD